MSLTTAPDIPLLITVPSPNADAPPLVSAERRITPAWTVSQLKSKLELVTGIPSESQILRSRSLDGSWIGLDDDDAHVGDERWSQGVRRGGEIEVTDSRPNLTDPTLSTVEKYTMPSSQYEQLSDSVLAWKKRQQLGRFDPTAKSPADLAAERRAKDTAEIANRGIKEGMRCRVSGDDGRRGVVKFVGEIEGLGGGREAGCSWVGVELDEPVGKNDGSVSVEVPGGGGREVRRLWAGRGEKYGIFVRPEKVEVGEEWGVLDDLMDEDLEEV